MSFRLQFRRYRVPFRRAVRTAHGLWPEREGVIVRLERIEGKGRAPEETSEGRPRIGFGEAAPIPWFGTETADEVEAACRALGEVVDDERLATVPERLGCLRHALAMARADLSAVGLAKGEVPPYLAIAALLPAGRAVLAEIPSKLDAGFRVFKWKVGVGDAADELALLDDVCAMLPAGAKLRLDANGAWDRRRAERWLERCAERPVEFIEQPVAADARGAEDLLLGLAHDFPISIALDESLIGERDLERWLGAGWPGVFVVKPALLAEPAAALARLAKAKAKVVFSSALETAIGARAALRLAFQWRGGEEGAEIRRHGDAERATRGERAEWGRRALGFGVWPLFADARFDGPAAAPFVRREDVEAIDVEAVWNALS